MILQAVPEWTAAAVDFEPMEDRSRVNQAAYIPGALLYLLLVGCAGAPPQEPPPVETQSAPAPVDQPPVGVIEKTPPVDAAEPASAPVPPAAPAEAEPAAPVIPPAPATTAPPAAPSTPAAPAAVKPARPAATAVEPVTPAPAVSDTRAPAAPATVKPPPAVPTPSAPAPSAPTTASASVPAKAPAPSLDLASLETRLRETKAIGVFTKLSLKNQVDDLLDQFRAFHKRQTQATLPQLRQSYDLLLLKVLSLLQDSDPPLARDIVQSRAAIWGILSNPKKFTDANLMAGAPS